MLGETGARPPGHKTLEASVLHVLIRVQDGGSTVCAVPHGEQTTLAGQQQAARGDNFLPNLTQLTAAELLALHSKIGEELRARGVVRSANSPTGDLAEHLFCAAFGWTQAPNSERGYDATGPDGTRFQIKGRRVHRRNPSRQLSAIRDLSSRQFDVLAGVIFDDDFCVVRAALIPRVVVEARSTYVTHTNSHKFILRDDVWFAPGVRDVTAKVAAAMP